MTNELEKKFFDTFGIEPKEHKECECDYLNCPYPDIEECEECYYYKTYKFDYPQITDTHYLKLICILSKSKAFYSNFYKIQDVNIEQLKEQVLTNCISKSIYFKHQVRTLFEEG